MDIVSGGHRTTIVQTTAAQKKQQQKKSLYATNLVHFYTKMVHFIQKKMLGALHIIASTDAFG